MTLLEKIDDLIIKATKEKSHYYVKSVLQECKEALNNKDEMEKEFNKIVNWGIVTFPSEDIHSRLNHLIEEVLELKDELYDYNGNTISKRLELADCYILLFGISYMLGGLTYKDVIEAIQTKMSINYTRTWNDNKL